MMNVQINVYFFKKKYFNLNSVVGTWDLREEFSI